MSDILTREQVKQRCDYFRDMGHCHVYAEDMLDHDAAQRERLAEKEQQLHDKTQLLVRIAETVGERDISQLVSHLEKSFTGYNGIAEALQQQLADLTAQCEGLERERDRMASILRGEALVERLHYESGQSLNLFLTHPLIAAIASSIADLLDQAHAENYLELGMHDKNGHAFTLTLQRAEKPTAHELRRLAEHQVADLTQQLASMTQERDLLNRDNHKMREQLAAFERCNDGLRKANDLYHSKIADLTARIRSQQQMWPGPRRS